MDFTLDDDQVALVDLAARILGDKLDGERLLELEADPDWFARDVWAEMARADLLGLCLPAVDGGGGYGIFEACLLLEQVGRAVAPVPLLAGLVAGAMPLAEFGTAAQRATWLPPTIAGEVVLTAGLLEPGGPLPPAHPATTAAPDGERWLLHGRKVFVPAAHLAQRILIPASTGPGTSAVFLVDPAAVGVTIEREVTTTYEPLATVTLQGVAVAGDEVLGGPEAADGGVVVAWMTERLLVGVCAMQAGVCESALRLTAAYTSQRRQFNAPIATFQAVAQRMADAYIDTEAVRLTAYQAAWRLARGEPAAEAIAIAKFWAADGGHRVVHAAQHLHGGVGVDVDYPVHRSFRWANQLELTLGGAPEHLVRLGALLAGDPVAEACPRI